MYAREVKALNPFQKFIAGLCQAMWERGFGAEDVTPNVILQFASRVQAVRRLRDEAGYEWIWPQAEQERVANVVRVNLAFRALPMFYWDGQLDVVTEGEKAILDSAHPYPGDVT